MSSVDIDKFDDVDDPAWDVPDVLNPSDLKDVDKDKIKVICDHKRRLKRIEAMKKILLALIAGMPGILAVIKGFFP